jgi:hypothetical protein
MAKTTKDTYRRSTSTYDTLHGYNDDYIHYREKSLKGISAKIEPLLKRLRQFDLLRTKLQTEGGDMSDLQALTQILTHKISLKGYDYHKQEVALINPKEVSFALYDIHPDLHFDVCILGNEMPTYYISRTTSDYHSVYNLIVEDLYTSPGYPKKDRFIKMMRYGHEEYYLCLSSFRDDLSRMKTAKLSTATQKDEMLYDAGRYVFDSAWHEDQQLSMLAADHLDMPNLRYAIELIYLCASGELCELRNAVMKQPALTDFFQTVYAQPAIYAFLKTITDQPGEALNTYQKRAIKCYGLLSQAYAGFLANTEIRWGMRSVNIPIYKILFANISRIGSITDQLKQNGGASLKKACKALDTYSKEIADTILNLQ